MKNKKLHYCCQECGTMHTKWSGKCTDCSAWNSLVEQKYTDIELPTGYAGSIDAPMQLMSNIDTKKTDRFTTNIQELDRVLGGGIVPGSVILVGGDPGIGKSTILLQMTANLSKNHKTIYITGEESLQQIKMRADRLGLEKAKIYLLAATNIEKISTIIANEKPHVVIIDSIQTIYTSLLSALPGTVSQLREATAKLVILAKQTNITIFIIGHVTKEGALAGPRVLEHMVDTVMYFEGQIDNKYRIMRSFKNRFGSVNELGIFAMTDQGLKEVNNPSAIFIYKKQLAVAGSVVMVTWEGSRPLLVEIQALVSDTTIATPRRVAVGLDTNRLIMILAVLQRYIKINTSHRDIFINVVGGLRINETATDLAVSLAVYSSLINKAFPVDGVVFGEMGLSGEIRPVQSGQERLKAAKKHGFKQAILPKLNLPKNTANDTMQLYGINNIKQAIDFFE